jgi:hypothetical protein
MRFRDVDNQKSNLIPVLLGELVESGHLPPERRSCVTAEDQHYGPLFRRQTG